MCQGCVDEGRMTAAELAERLAAGDKGVAAMSTLEPQEFMGQVVKLCLEAIVSGMDPELAVDATKELVAVYAMARPMAEAELAAFLAELDEI